MRGKKQDLRLEAVRQRESLPFSEACARSHLIQEAAIHFAPYLSADSVALYSALGNEVSTEKIRDHAFRTRKSVYYPGLAEQDPKLIRAQSAEDLKPGRYGILEPAGEKTLSINGAEGLVIFVPGLYFDRNGHRLGRGRGWYDRLLQGFGRGVTVIALAYEFQILEEVPVESSMDVSVHHIITESRIIDCRDPEAVGLNSWPYLK